MKELITRDLLAIERTRLANERTFLSYFRSSVVILSSGFAIVGLDALEEITDLGIFLLLLGPGILVLGIGRFIYVKKQIKKYYTLKHINESLPKKD